jgi:dUTPase
MLFCGHFIILSCVLLYIYLLDEWKFTTDDDSIHVPQVSTLCSAGYDIFLPYQDLILEPNEKKWVSTGVKLIRQSHSKLKRFLLRFLPMGRAQVVFLLKERSSLADTGLEIPAGVIDCDYSGEIKVLVKNTSFERLVIPRMSRFAQLLPIKLFHSCIVDGHHMVDKQRGDSGFGSTNRTCN